MQTITQKKKKSTLLWAVIITLFAIVLIVGVLSFLGYISLQFVADGLIGYMNFGAASVTNAVLAIGGPFLLGMLTWYAIKKWFIGEKVVTTMQQGGYTPGGQTISNPAQQQGTETVIN